MALTVSGDPAQMVCELLARRAPMVANGNRLPTFTASAADLSDRNSIVPDASWLSRPLAEILPRRQSVREFAPEPVPLDIVRRIIRDAYSGERRTWTPGVHGAASVVVLLAAARVIGLDPGVYSMPPAKDDFIALADSEPLAVLRHNYAHAPATLLICGDPHQGIRDGCGISYGSVLVRAGTLGYGAWLAAISADLAGSVYGRTSQEVTLIARRFDPRLRHMFTVAIGSPMSG